MQWFTLLIILTTTLMLVSLNDRILWGDEAEVALLAQNILQFGYPKMDDGNNVIYSDYTGAITLPGILGEDLIWKWHPWLSHYITAAFFMLFGVTTVAGRLPFALLGIACIPLLYILTRKISTTRTALFATILLTFFTPFYLYSRQLRYYSLAMFLSLLVVYAYVRFLKQERHSWLLPLASILLFHTNYVPFIGVYAGIGSHLLLFHRSKQSILRFAKISIIVMIFTVPWYMYAQLYGKSQPFSFLHILFSVAYLSLYFVIYTIPVLTFLFLPWKKRFNWIILLLLIPLFTMIAASFAPWELPSFRYLSALFPLAMILPALALSTIFQKSKPVALILLILLIFTNIFFVAPFKIVEPLALSFTDRDDTRAFIKDNFRFRFFFFDYLSEITHDYTNQNDAIVTYLLEHGKPTDSFLTNVEDLIYIFYTDMHAYKIADEKKPNWIIPRQSYALWSTSKQKDYDFVISQIDASYEQVILDVPEHIYPPDSPHPRVHFFRSNDVKETLHDYPQQTYPTIIYHRQ